MKGFIIYITLLFIAMLPTQDDAKKASLRFEIKNAGITVKGYFESWDYSVVFDPKNIAGCKLSGKAEIATIKTGNASRDKHLQTRQYFKSETWPNLTMISREIVHKGGNRYEGIFDVTIRDVTKQLTVPFTADRNGDSWKLSGSFTLNRLDFGVGEKSIILSNEVKVVLAVASE